MEAASREQLRAWLAENRERNESVWLVTWKKAAGAKHLPYAAIVEEALCFGWIDSLPRSLDAERSMRLLSPRRPGAAWSNANRERAERLIAEGRMTEAGLAKIEAAKRDGSWTRIEGAQAGDVPDDLAEALARRPPAADRFAAFPPSSKRVILEWIGQAKRPETRAKRIEETAEKASRNIRANHYRSRTASGALPCSTPPQRTWEAPYPPPRDSMRRAA